jgi:hypothetical protein
MWRRRYASGIVKAVKYYPAGATTNSDSGVSDIHKVEGVLEVMQEIGMPLLLHGEVTDPEVDIFDREAVFIDRVLAPLLRRLPKLKVVLEHITTRQAAEFVRKAPANVAATITAHHLLYNRNAMFQGGMRPHYYCLPVLKRETHRHALMAKRRFPATRSSSSAPTAHRMPNTPRKPPAAAPASTPRMPRWNCMPRHSNRLAHWTGWKAFRQFPRSGFLRPAAQSDQVTLRTRTDVGQCRSSFRRRAAACGGNSGLAFACGWTLNDRV